MTDPDGPAAASTGPEGSAAPSADLTERVVDSRVVHKGHYMEFRVDTIERADGTRGRARHRRASRAPSRCSRSTTPTASSWSASSGSRPAMCCSRSRPGRSTSTRRAARSRTPRSRRGASSRRRPATGPGRGGSSARSGPRRASPRSSCTSTSRRTSSRRSKDGWARRGRAPRARTSAVRGGPGGRRPRRDPRREVARRPALVRPAAPRSGKLGQIATRGLLGSICGQGSGVKRSVLGIVSRPQLPRRPRTALRVKEPSDLRALQPTDACLAE